MQRLSIVVLAALAAVLSIAALGVAWGAASKVGRAAQGSPVPTTVAYQGFLTDIKGNPVPNGARTVTFRLYAGATGGSALWQETQTITTDRGVFNALLGSGTAFGSVFDTAPLHLGVQIAGEPELRPRQELSATPFALRAADADALGGRPASAFVSGATGTNGVDASVTNGNLSLGLRENYRLPQGCLPGKVAKWVFTGLSTMGWACGADIAGEDVDTSTFQQRILGRCAIGSAMRGVDADGSPVCFGPLVGEDHEHTTPRIFIRTPYADYTNETGYYEDQFGNVDVVTTVQQARCNDDEVLTGGGFRTQGGFHTYPNGRRNANFDPEHKMVILESRPDRTENLWKVKAQVPGGWQIWAYAVCTTLRA